MQKCLVNIGGKLVLGTEDQFGNVFTLGSIRPKRTIPDLTDREQLEYDINQALQSAFSNVKATSITVAKIEEKQRIHKTKEDLLIDQIVDLILPDIVEEWTGDDEAYDAFFPKTKVMVDDWRSCSMDMSFPYVPLNRRHFICTECSYKQTSGKTRWMSNRFCQNPHHLDQENMSDYRMSIVDCISYEATQAPADDWQEEIDTIRGEIMDYYDFDSDDELEDFITCARIGIKKAFTVDSGLAMYRVIWHAVKETAFRYNGNGLLTAMFWSSTQDYITAIANEETIFDWIDAEDYGEIKLDDILPAKDDRGLSSRKDYKKVEFDTNRFRMVEKDEWEMRDDRWTVEDELNDRKWSSFLDKIDDEDESEADDEDLDAFDWDF